MRGQRILIVDDEEGTCKLLKERLTKQGYVVSIAQNGEEAVQKVLEEFPALVIMDIILPDFDGAEAVRRIRANPTTARIPIVFLSSIVSGDDVQGSSKLKVGDVSYVAFAKPVDMKLLLRQIEKCLPASE